MRSGTTLLRRIVSMHPMLKYELVHENPQLLLSSRSTEDALKKLTYPATQEGKKTGSIMSLKSGQKIPYTNYQNAFECITKFRSFFPKGSIIHIIRNPTDTISSQIRFRPRTLKSKATKFFRSIYYLGIFNCYMRKYFDSVPRVRSCLNTYENTLEIRYEKLIKDTVNEVSSIYRWIGNNVETSYIEKVISAKTPWEYNGRMMPGLRYFDKIENQIFKNIVLRNDQIETIKQLSKLNGIDIIA